MLRLKFLSSVAKVRRTRRASSRRSLGQLGHQHAGAVIGVRAPIGGVGVGVVGGAHLPAVIQRADELVFGEDVRGAVAVAHFFQPGDAGDFGMVDPVVEVDPTGVVELHDRAGSIKRRVIR